MEILSEYELRAKCLPLGTEEYRVSGDTFVMPGAKEYLRERGIKLVVGEGCECKDEKFNPMPQTAIKSGGDDKYVDYETGKGYSYKPENMTHIRGNLLVSKTHPRIAFRGKLDSLEAKIMETQIVAQEMDRGDVVNDLEEIYGFVRTVLSAEVNEKPLGEFKLLGMDSGRLRYASHHVHEEFGIGHYVPSYTMGKLCVALNALRTAVRETELSAAQAFTKENVTDRVDIIEALNRLSSCVYIVYCRVLSGELHG
ncbi:MAG: hypothetical protein K5756_07430 [Clostridiales bacterium]|nr:hypothetical protein [Clostridiales bacterium]